MDSLKIIQKINSNPIVKMNMSMQMQLGFPFLEKKGDYLCMSFKPHMEMPDGDSIKYYTPQYELVLVYPFEKIIKYEDLSFSNTGAVNKPIANVKIRTLLSDGKAAMDELYEACNRVLDFQKEDGRVSDTSIKKYQKKYYEVVNRMGLSAVYGSGK